MPVATRARSSQCEKTVIQSHAADGQAPRPRHTVCADCAAPDRATSARTRTSATRRLDRWDRAQEAPGGPPVHGTKTNLAICSRADGELHVTREIGRRSSGRSGAYDARMHIDVALLDKRLQPVFTVLDEDELVETVVARASSSSPCLGFVGAGVTIFNSRQIPELLAELDVLYQHEEIRPEVSLILGPVLNATSPWRRGEYVRFTERSERAA